MKWVAGLTALYALLLLEAHYLEGEPMPLKELLIASAPVVFLWIAVWSCDRPDKTTNAEMQRKELERLWRK